MWEIRSRRAENNRQNSAVHANVVTAIVRCLTILRSQYELLGIIAPSEKLPVR